MPLTSWNPRHDLKAGNLKQIAPLGRRAVLDNNKLDGSFRGRPFYRRRNKFIRRLRNPQIGRKSREQTVALVSARWELFTFAALIINIINSS